MGSPQRFESRAKFKSTPEALWPLVGDTPTLNRAIGLPPIEYELTPRGPGVLRFEGVELRVTDLAGFFYHRLFLRAPADVLVLPPLVDDAGKQRADKRFNTLPPPGVHRLRRPGGQGGNNVARQAILAAKGLPGAVGVVGSSGARHRLKPAISPSSRA